MAIDCKANSYRAPRWALAWVVLLVCTYCLLASEFSVCNVETVTAKDATTTTKRCSGPTVTDAGVVAIALLVVLLLAPDMSEVGIFGVSLKRRLEAAETKAERLEAQLHVQNLRVDTLSQNLASSNAQGIGQLIITTADAIKKDVSGLPQKADAYLRGTRPEETFIAPSTDAPSPTLVTTLISNWETLAASLDLPPYQPSGRRNVQKVPLTAEQANRFSGIFANELKLVRAARNTVAHAGAIESDALQSATDLSAQLLDILRRTPPE